MLIRRVDFALFPGEVAIREFQPAAFRTHLIAEREKTGFDFDRGIPEIRLGKELLRHLAMDSRGRLRSARDTERLSIGIHRCR